MAFAAADVDLADHSSAEHISAGGFHHPPDELVAEDATKVGVAFGYLQICAANSGADDAYERFAIAPRDRGVAREAELAVKQYRPHGLPCFNLLAW
jgi:hypothetical protein